jgi:hypothetical protein
MFLRRKGDLEADQQCWFHLSNGRLLAGEEEEKADPFPSFFFKWQPQTLWGKKRSLFPGKGGPPP